MGDSASTGYLFGNSDSYSTYGMLAKVVEVRGMTFSGPDPVPPAQGPTGQGTIPSAGQMTRKEVYNYPLYVNDTSGTASSNLTDAPTYTSMTDSWTRDGSVTDQAVTSFDVQQLAIPRTVTITLPNGTKNKQSSYNAPGQYLDGLVYLDETYVTPGTVLQSSFSNWAQGAYDSPRPTRVEVTNERAQKTATDFIYGAVYNQVTEVRNYDYGGINLLRSTRTQPFNSTDLATTLAQSGVSSYYVSGYANTPTTISINRTGQYVRVQRSDSQYLVLAEVQVWSGIVAPGPGPTVPRDGFGSLSYDQTSNRINTTGWNYDAAGNQTRVQTSGGGWQKFQYDAANRLVNVLADDGTTVLSSYTYGDDNSRLIVDEGGLRTYYPWDGICEYTESGGSTTPAWSKSYIYLGARLLSTVTPNGSGGETFQYHHPDRLGTRLVTNPVDGTSFEQVSLPFGTALDGESTGSTKRRFTSYDRSATTGLDYANNRHYDPQQGRFTQVDPIGMRSVSLESPQTLNLYAYCANDPVNRADPSGLGFFSAIGHLFKKAFNLIGKILSNKWVQLAVGIALGIAAGIGFVWAAQAAGTAWVKVFLTAAIVLSAMSATLIVGSFHPTVLAVSQFIGGIATAAQSFLNLIHRPLFGTPPWNPAGSAVGPIFHLMAPDAKERPLNQLERDILFNVLEAAKQALKDKPECLKYIGADAIKNIDFMWGKGLYTFFPGVQATASLPPGWAATAAPHLFSRTRTVFLYSFFYDKDRLKAEADLYGISPFQKRMVTVFHEMKHYIDPLDRTHDTWNTNIVDKCIK